MKSKAFQRRFCECGPEQLIAHEWMDRPPHILYRECMRRFLGLEKRKWELVMSVIFILCAVTLAERGFLPTVGTAVTGQEGERIVMIDAGHGGNDPGKIGVDNSKEKDVNLQIARKLKVLLEQQDLEVRMTREEDKGLYEEHSSNKKAQDLKNRCELINKTNPNCVVSIHQNSYHEEPVKGAQVFYYEASEEAKELAEEIQEKLISYVDPRNHRQAKANESYYLLKKTSAPVVIVECGFLSNWTEAKLLQEESYQSRIAWAIAMGVQRYLNTGR